MRAVRVLVILSILLLSACQNPSNETSPESLQSLEQPIEDPLAHAESPGEEMTGIEETVPGEEQFVESPVNHADASEEEMESFEEPIDELIEDPVPSEEQTVENPVDQLDIQGEAIKNLDEWTHPVKDVLLEHELNIDQVVLANDSTRPYFFVSDTSTYFLIKDSFHQDVAEAYCDADFTIVYKVHSEAVSDESYRGFMEVRCDVEQNRAASYWDGEEEVDYYPYYVETLEKASEIMAIFEGEDEETGDAFYRFFEGIYDGKLRFSVRRASDTYLLYFVELDPYDWTMEYFD